MATGYLFSGPIHGTGPAWQDTADLPWSAGIKEGVLVPGWLVPAFVSTQPVESNPANYTGKLFGAFSADYYNRIHVVPASIELGNITSGQSREFYVWSAYLDVVKVLDTIDVTGDDTGITLGQPDALPSSYLPLEIKTYQLDFSTNGPATISVTYTLTFTDATVRTVDVTGRRAIMFGFEPNWQEPFVEELEWLTNIIETEEGLEYRQRLRGNPRRVFEYDVIFTEADKRKLEQYMWAWKARPFIVPIWSDCQKLSATVAAGSFTINISTENLSFVEGGLVAVLTDPLNTEVLEIDTMTTSQITLKNATINEWPAGARIMPALSAQMPDTSSLNRVTAGLTSGTVRFSCAGNKAIPAVESTTLHQGLGVVTDQPYMGEDQQVDWESKIETIDTGIGDPFYDIRADLNDQVDSFSFYVKGRDEIWRWRQWMHAREGRYSQFFMPLWSRDFILAEGIAPTQTVLEFYDTQYRTFYDLHPVKRDIMIKTRNEGTFYRRITAVAESLTAGQETFSIDSQLGVAVAPEDVIMISFLQPSRLANDTVNIEWISGDQAMITFKTRAIEQ
jgi:hypothetical protein